MTDPDEITEAEALEENDPEIGIPDDLEPDAFGYCVAGCMKGGACPRCLCCREHCRCARGGR